MSSDDRARSYVPEFGLRLGLWYATLFIAGAIAIVYVTYSLTASSLVQRDRQIVQQKLGEYAAAYARGGIRTLTNLVAAEQRTAPERLFVRVVDRGSEVIVLSDREGWDERTLETASAVLADGTLVQVGKSSQARLDLLARFRATLGLVTLLIVIIALTGGWLVTQSALQPIRRLSEAVQRIITTGRTDERVAVSRHDDAINELTLLFNAMLDRIGRLVTGMRGALDNVSHDLRTPLTRLRGTAEMALAAPQPDVERYREALADCVEETDRVLTMLNTLMDITEAESGAMPLKRDVVGLHEVIARVMDLYRDAAEARAVDFSAGPLDQVNVVGDRVRLEQVFANLVDNAVKYTPAGGKVEIVLKRDGARAVTEVRDTGPGIPADELPRIWERLFRGDRSRTERGLGLGLSLVQAVVAAHGGTVEVTSEVGRGSVFTVALPLSPKPANLSHL